MSASASVAERKPLIATGVAAGPNSDVRIQVMDEGESIYMARVTYKSAIEGQKSLCPPPPVIPSQTYNPQDFLDRQDKLLMKVTDLTVVEGAGKVLLASEPKEGIATVIAQNTCDDLGLTSSRDRSLASVIDRTLTIVGRLFFLGRVSRPKRNLNTVKDRQRVAQQLQATPQLLSDLKGQLQVLKENESHMLGFEESRLALPGRIDKLFWKYGIERLDKAANANAHAVTFNAAVETSKALVGNGLQTAAVVVLPLYAVSLTNVLPEEMTSFLGEYARRFAGSSGPLYALASATPSNVIRGGMGLLGGAIASLSLKTQWTWFVTDLKMEQMLHQKMLSVARYYRAAKTIYQSLSKYPTISQKLEQFEKLDRFFKNPKLKPIFDAFESRTFNGEAGFFFQRGKVLVPWRMLEDLEIRKHFREAITALAEIDAVVGTATLMEEFQEERVTFSFPEFIEDSATPVVELTEYWHPVVGKVDAVPNTILLGERHGAPNIVITGPNAGGKSTSLRAITSAVALAQAGLPVPARKMRLTPFDQIISSMQTTDSVQTGDSLFQAQTKKVSAVEESLQRGDFVISALDEMFTGTNGEQGEALAVSSTRQLSTYPNGITMSATHFRKVAELEKERGSRIKNRKVTATMEGSKVISSYKLEEGVSNQNLAFEVAAAAGLSSAIVDAARAQRAKD